MKTTTIAPRTLPPLPAIRLGQSDRTDAETRYGVALAWFMRVLAFLWMAQGLADWGLMLGGSDGTQDALQHMSDLGAASVIFFAVLDLIAAVGLWLGASWGGVVWLVAVAAQWLTLMIVPGFPAYEVAISVLNLVLVVAYFALTYRAAREIDQ